MRTLPSVGAITVALFAPLVSASACGGDSGPGSGGNTSASSTATGQSGATTSTGTSSAVTEAATDFCSAACVCDPCMGDTLNKCIAELEPTGRGPSCDALLVEQIQCATSTLKDCPANWNWDDAFIPCAPPQDEQEAACGPGGLPG